MSDFNDDLIGKRLYSQIVYEIHNDKIKNERFFVVVARTNGDLYAKQYGRLSIHTAQVMYARFACQMLNKKVRHDGAWVVVWYAPSHQGVPTRLTFLWKDKDGDVPTTYTTDAPVEELIQRGPEWACEMAEGVIAKYRDWLKEMDIRPDQQIKAAQGQKSADPTAAPSI